MSSLVEHTNRETQDEQAESQSRNLLTDLELRDDLVDATTVCTRNESDRQSSDCNQRGDEPFLRLWEKHRIAGIILDPIYNKRIFFGAGAFVVPFCYFGGYSRW